MDGIDESSGCASASFSRPAAMRPTIGNPPVPMASRPLASQPQDTIRPLLPASENDEKSALFHDAQRGSDTAFPRQPEFADQIGDKKRDVLRLRSGYD
jgi:hypothetical protein